VSHIKPSLTLPSPSCCDNFLYGFNGTPSAGRAVPALATLQREAVLQPPKSENRSAAKILEAARERDAAPEAAS
jgi:hypothetical protein